MALNRQTTASVMKALNIEFNMWESHPGSPELIGYWQERLAHVGMTDENAKALRQGFVRYWDTGKIPTLHNVCGWIKEQLSAWASGAAGSAPPGSVEEREAQLKRERAFIASAEGGSMIQRMREKVSAALRQAQDPDELQDVPEEEIPF